MGIVYASGGWRLLTIESAEHGPPMRVDATVRDEPGSVWLTRGANGLRIDMDYGGTVDVNRFSGAYTQYISGCRALILVNTDGGGITRCFFSHARATHSTAHAERAVDILGSLATFHAVLIDNYGADAKWIDVLVAGGLLPARLLVYTNRTRQSNQAFGVRFADGLCGEFDPFKETATEPASKNVFQQGFDTTPATMSALQMLLYQTQADTLLERYLALFTYMDRDIFGAGWMADDPTMTQRITEHGNEAIASYLNKADTAVVPLMRAHLRQYYASYDFPVLR